VKVGVLHEELVVLHELVLHELVLVEKVAQNQLQHDEAEDPLLMVGKMILAEEHQPLFV
jgi:hypothetical protein